MSKCLYCQKEVPEGIMVCPVCVNNLTPTLKDKEHNYISTKSNVRLGKGTVFFNGLNVGVATISECNITSEGDIYEKDFKVIKSPSETTFKCSAKIKVPFKWRLRWKWYIFKSKISCYKKYRKTRNTIYKMYLRGYNE